MALKKRNLAAYAGIALITAVLAITFSFTSFATQLDNDFYDFLFRLFANRTAGGQAVVAAIDEKTLLQAGGMRGIRPLLTRALEQIAAGKPTAVAVDLTLADKGDPKEDAKLAQAMKATPNLVLGCEMLPDSSGWQDPTAILLPTARALGHVSAMADGTDAVNREVPLERVAGGKRRWALSLETYRLSTGAEAIESSPTDVVVADRTIHSRWDRGRPLRIRYRPANEIPTISISQLLEVGPGRSLEGKSVFIGVTAQSASPDRLMTPVSFGVPMPGVAIHAQAYDTLAEGLFLYDTPLFVPVILALLFAFLGAGIFAIWQGGTVYTAAGILMLAVHGLPVLLFQQGWVLPPSAPVTAAWVAVLAAGSWQYFVVRRQLAASEQDRNRYQQAIRFVTHEMRTPLTAIQGSSELITRYNLPEDKRRQLGEMINSESKRLAGMITTFLNVEKLGAGQMELRKVMFPLSGMAKVCVDRARPLAERKQIEIQTPALVEVDVHGDPELLEYAVYNLLTNAVKYSPQNTEITLSIVPHGREVHLSVRDQGYGLEEKELRQLFTKFFRAGSAQKSGEVGTGLGLSIVEQIVTHHGGRVAVESRPGAGSCFTLILPMGT